MEDISFYFAPVASERLSESGLGQEIDIHTEHGFPELKKGGIAVFYVPEFRKSNYSNPASEKFREQLYELHSSGGWEKQLYDLGDVLPGESVNDTYFAVGKIVAELVKNQIIPVLIGGSQDMTMALYKGYEKLEQFVNLCSIDSKLDIGNPDEEIHAEGYISQLLVQRPCYLFNHANIGLQIPFAKKDELELFEKLYFDYCRLGEFNADFKRAEPHLRNSDILSIDLTSLRYSELVDSQYTNPNGFYAEQMCQMARYAGVSDKLTSIGIFNYLPEKSTAVNISNLVAQIIWYFIDGVNARVGDFPIGTRKEYMKFIVHLDDFTEQLTFYKSDKSARWWMEVPYPAEEGRKYERHYLVPCNQEDYERAMKNEIPDLWWKTYQKLV
ncbi:formimidoylglutamase [Crocinitomicaceae bacterium CZZ-1]|uniref:Formimidoylglutamase n=1 Tax=Taishania pollutisoli TaxID=2766479 RepID=A0A8J6P691_9FLAO|nr:formimidoylglutamase [Taishania pollutisoli]MBC9812647.1 formimidoylglutamase [Taishania pollutisoli]MBX2949198.1 formimidoylglutamase [Crocinitomicaceae bacterium]NGF75870.1 formimidoylglutamase [Fluviicola sp. SGL-29]